MCENCTPLSSGRIWHCPGVLLKNLGPGVAHRSAMVHQIGFTNAAHCPIDRSHNEIGQGSVDGLLVRRTNSINERKCRHRVCRVLSSCRIAQVGPSIVPMNDATCQVSNVESPRAGHCPRFRSTKGLWEPSSPDISYPWHLKISVLQISI